MPLPFYSIFGWEPSFTNKPFSTFHLRESQLVVNIRFMVHIFAIWKTISFWSASLHVERQKSTIAIAQKEKWKCPLYRMQFHSWIVTLVCGFWVTMKRKKEDFSKRHHPDSSYWSTFTFTSWRAFEAPNQGYFSLAYRNNHLGWRWEVSPHGE